MTAKKRRDFIIKLAEKLFSAERKRRRQVLQVLHLKRIREGADDDLPQ